MGESHDRRQASGDTPVKIHAALEEPGSKLGRYMDLVLGKRSVWALARFEFITLLVRWIPGAAGIVLRGKLYPLILGHVGRGVIFGSGITFRHPHKIRLGDGCVVDDNCMLDAKGSSNQGIDLGAGVFLGRGTILGCKNGDIRLEDRVNLGFSCYVFSSGRVVIGEDTVVAAYTYVMSGGTYRIDRLDLPIAEQYDLADSKPTEIGAGSWLGARVTVLEGVKVGRGCVLGAGAVVTADVPDHGIALGIPAKTVRIREDTR